LDRYRKHALMFEYWNGELIDALGPAGSNVKRIKRASAEALQELTTLQSTLQEDYAALLQPMLEARRSLDAQVQRGTYMPPQRDQLLRSVEAQTRQFSRQFSWRDVEDHLKSEEVRE
jgi:phytoene dehydrogenase-like protein